MKRLLRVLALIGLLGLLAACNAPGSTPSTDAGSSATSADKVTEAFVSDGENDKESYPLDEDLMPPPKDQTAIAEVTANEVDYSCTTDADCTIKDIGNCCGYYPACVNIDSPTFPEQVKARCQETGTSGVCGFPSLVGCRCTQGRCEGVSGASASGIRID